MGAKSNVIGDHAVLELNLRTFSGRTASSIRSRVRRIVTAECQASGSPRDPEFEMMNHFPATDNDPRGDRGVVVGGREVVHHLELGVPRRPEAKTSATSPPGSTRRYAPGSAPPKPQ
ncbi:hypothetical protein MAHJHV55_54650 [Mycobacterium avium subsp. hominissuis]